MRPGQLKPTPSWHFTFTPASAGVFFPIYLSFRKRQVDVQDRAKGSSLAGRAAYEGMRLPRASPASRTGDRGQSAKGGLRTAPEPFVPAMPTGDRASTSAIQ